MKIMIMDLFPFHGINEKVGLANFDTDNIELSILTCCMYGFHMRSLIDLIPYSFKHILMRFKALVILV